MMTTKLLARFFDEPEAGESIAVHKQKISEGACRAP
jgi:hypothetical protein